jgi:predicted ATPase/class 3 adenylate cyclase
MTELPTGTVTFLLTDIEGSTRLWEQHPDAMSAAVARHDALAAGIIAQHEGVLVKSQGEGDSLFAVFGHAADALAAALALQIALRESMGGMGGAGGMGSEETATSHTSDTPHTPHTSHTSHTSPNPQPPTPGPQLRVRMALHTGTAALRDGDYYGAAVNRCARLRGIAHGGQVLLSLAAEERVREALPERASLKALGAHRLRDLERPEHVFQLLHPELPAGFPPLRSLSTLPNNLPQQVTTFIGRQREIAEVNRLLGGTRLLTLTGAGGIGKTRLALQVAADPAEEFPDGTWLVELAPLADPALVPHSTAAVLSVREEPGQSTPDALIASLKPKRLLLVLDNCEHVLTACAALADTLLRACPHLRILATSREGLGITGELTYRVPSLSLPPVEGWWLRVEGEEGSLPSTLNPQPSTLLESEAVRLFAERAAFSRPGFAITDRNAPAVAQVCQRLDGIPLAIELAAARVRVLPVEQIAARLDDRFHLLTGGSRTALPRHQTLRALIDWSYDLLSEAERTLLRRLSVFAGSWTLEAAEAIADCGLRIADWETAGTDRLPASDPMPGSDPKGSPARADAGSGAGSSQPAMRSGVQESGARGQGEAGSLNPPLAKQSSAIRNPQLDVLDLLSHLVDKSLVVAEEEGGEARYRLLETVRQYGRERLVEAGELESAQERHLDYFLQLAEGCEARLGKAAGFQLLEKEYPNLRAALVWCLSEKNESAPLHPSSFRLHPSEAALRLARPLQPFWWMHGYHREGRAWLARALAAGEGIPASMRGAAIHNAGELAFLEADYEAARALFEESAAEARRGGDGSLLASALLNLGRLARRLDERERARALLEESLTASREAGDRVTAAWAVGELGWLAEARHDLDLAAPLIEESLELFRRLGDQVGIAWALHLAAGVHVWRHGASVGDVKRGRALLEESLAIRRELGDQMGIAWALGDLGRAARGEGDLGRARELLEESLAMRRQLRDRFGMMWTLNELGLVALDQEDAHAARAYVEELVSLARELGERKQRAWGLVRLGDLCRWQGDYGAAQARYEESLAVGREIEDPESIARSLSSLGLCELQQAHCGAARKLFEEALTSGKAGIAWGIPLTLGRLAMLAAAQGSGHENAIRAARLFGAEEAHREEMRIPASPGHRADAAPYVAAAREALDEDTFTAAWEEGRSMSLEEAIACALETLEG